MTDPSPRATIASVVPLVPAWRVDRPFDYSVPEALAGAIEPGSLVRIPLSHRRVRGIVVDLRPGGSDGLEEIVNAVWDYVAIPPSMLGLADFIATRYAALKAPTLSRMLPSRIRIAATTPGARPALPTTQPLADYADGDLLVRALEDGAAGLFCVQAAPGEDRAGVIGRLGAIAAGTGRATLACVPEVRFGSAVLDALGAKFPGLARLDSARSEAERARGWRSMAAGNWIGAGGRAAVLAPARPLGLIVIDEEGHRSYKEDRSPRYDARRVAIERARLEGAVCVLMSQTPSVESVGSGVTLIRPPRERLRAGRPIVELVDVPDDRAVSHELHSRMREVLRAGDRVALLAPRRGYSRALWCTACRRSIRCGVCEGAMVFDRAGGRIRCPRCGVTAAPPDRCPSCGGLDFRMVGAGSERLAEQVGRAFPRSRVMRMDPETLDSEMQPQDSDIYVTTWIGTKAALRPDVKLVGVLDADALIHRSDWRASESTFHALWEMAAWAGPAEDGGKLIVQTNQPAHHAVQGVVRADLGWFIERELSLREELSYPPFSELIRVVAIGPDAALGLDRVREVARSHGARFLGPVRSPRTAGGLEALLKCRDATAVGGDLRGILAAGYKGTRIVVDTDPH